MNRLIQLLKAAGLTVSSDATLEQLEDMALDAIGEGKIKAAEWKAAKKEHTEYEQVRSQRMDEIADRTIEKMKAAGLVVSSAPAPQQGSDNATGSKIATKAAGGSAAAADGEPPEDDALANLPSDQDIEAYVDKRLKALFGDKLPAQAGGDGATLTQQILKAAVDRPKDGVKVKSCAERFNATKSIAKYSAGPLRGQDIRHEGRVLEFSELDSAICAVWCKVQSGLPMTHQDLDIFEHALRHSKWVGYDRDRVEGRFLTEAEQAEIKAYYGLGNYDPVTKSYRTTGDMFRKDVIDETSNSGGAHAVPEVYDDTLIILPILQGEILQFVNLINLARGSALEGATVANPSFTWGGVAVEGTTLTEIDTDSFIGDFTIPIFRTAARIDLGQDWMEDALPNMFGQIQDRFRAAHLADLGVQIATGDGTTEPQGFKNASGIISVTPTNPDGQPAIADHANLLFAVTKAFRFMEGRATGRSAVFVSREVRYKQTRQLATGVTGDERYFHGMDLEGYALFGHTNVIDDNGMELTDYAFLQAKAYRLVRRRGLRFRRVDTGFTPTVTNLTTLVADARYGGKLERGGYCALISNLGAGETST